MSAWHSIRYKIPSTCWKLPRSYWYDPQPSRSANSVYQWYSWICRSIRQQTEGRHVFPNNGRFAEPTEHNALGRLDIPSTNALLNHEYSTSIPHPVIRTTEHHSAYDRFHEDNACIPQERLRKLDIVEQMKNSLNSEVVEQIFSKLNKSRYFMDSLAP